MDNVVTRKRRSVLPRWRSLARTPDHELDALEKKRAAASLDFTPRLNNALSRWRLTRSLEEAVDVLDLAIELSSHDAAYEVATWINERSSEYRPSILASANSVTSGRTARSISETDVRMAVLYGTVSALKKRMIDSPQDAISACELARVYTILGQQSPAKTWIGRALSIAPDDRYVLRGAAQFYTHIGDPAEGLAYIERSASVRHDPWVQAQRWQSRITPGKALSGRCASELTSWRVAFR